MEGEQKADGERETTYPSIGTVCTGKDHPCGKTAWNLLKVHPTLVVRGLISESVIPLHCQINPCFKCMLNMPFYILEVLDTRELIPTIHKNQHKRIYPQIKMLNWMVNNSIKTCCQAKFTTERSWLWIRCLVWWIINFHCVYDILFQEIN